MLPLYKFGNLKTLWLKTWGGEGQKAVGQGVGEGGEGDQPKIFHLTFLSEKSTTFVVGLLASRHEILHEVHKEP